MTTTTPRNQAIVDAFTETISSVRDTADNAERELAHTVEFLNKETANA